MRVSQRSFFLGLTPVSCLWDGEAHYCRMEVLYFCLLLL
uniref:Uncharacterized protein n=1 Tax=Setaria italica TaxID=4555 RepID=K4AN44_SETIT